MVKRRVRRCAVVLALAVAPIVAAQAPAGGGIADRVAPCLACHDDAGRRGPDTYYPRIAGKPAGYLANQLQHFKEGRRFYALMTYLVDHLPEAYLNEMAAYFANLDRPYLPPQSSTARPAVLERGRVLTTDGDAKANLPACAECHGKSLTGIAPAIPGIVGLPRDYIVAQLNNWRSGVRRSHAPDCMSEIAKRLSPDDIAAVAGWLATLNVLGRAIEPAEPPRLPLACGGVPGGTK
jgi:cytochrome c553